MSTESRWIRLNVDWSKTEWLFVLSAESKLVWLELLCYCKVYGNRRGACPSKSPLVLSRLFGVGEESVVQLLAAAKNAGAVVMDGDMWVFTSWDKYQGPDTISKRVRRATDSPGLSGTVRDTCHVTETVTATGTETVTSIKPDPSTNGAAEAAPEEILELAPDGGSVITPEIVDDVSEVIIHLNKVCGKHYKPDGKQNRGFIKARMKEDGATVAQLEMVADYQASEWKGTTQDKYLRPETLYRAGHWENYLQEAEAWNLRGRVSLNGNGVSRETAAQSTARRLAATQKHMEDARA